MIKIIETIILGVIQGITEFLPVSSSAHLIIFRDIFGVGSFITGEYELCFDVALHFGTLLAILIYFMKDFIKMVKDFFNKGLKNTKGNLLLLIIVATIPAAIMGVLFEDIIDGIIRNNYIVIIIALFVMGIIINYADKLGESTKTLKDMTIKDAFLIGLFQVCAMVPGFSRSGTTISTARILKYNRSDAAKFSFYLSFPVVLGAVLITILKGNMISLITYDLKVFIIGVLISFVVGILCIKFLLKYIKKHDYEIFMWYRFVLALIVLFVLLFK